MGTVRVPSGSDPAKVIKKLFKAADKLEVDQREVVFSPEGYVEAPEEVADKAGLSYDAMDEPDEVPTVDEQIAENTPKQADLDEQVKAQDADQERLRQDAHKQALAAARAQQPKADDANADDGDSSSNEEPLRGKALDEALEKAGLSKNGRVAEKQARLAEHQSKGN